MAFVPESAAADDVLARSAQQGSQSAFEEIVRRYQTPLLHFLLSKTGAKTDAEDLLQETFLRAYASISRYDGRSVRGWLFTIAYHLAIDWRRSRRQSEVINAQDKKTAVTPEESLLQHERRQLLWSKAREVLNDEQFTALWLYYAEDLTVAEAAQVLNRGQTMTKVLLYRARRKLAAHVAELQLADAEQESDRGGATHA